MQILIILKISSENVNLNGEEPGFAIPKRIRDQITPGGLEYTQGFCIWYTF